MFDAPEAGLNKASPTAEAYALYYWLWFLMNVHDEESPVYQDSWNALTALEDVVAVSPSDIT